MKAQFKKGGMALYVGIEKRYYNTPVKILSDMPASVLFACGKLIGVPPAYDIESCDGYPGYAHGAAGKTIWVVEPHELTPIPTFKVEFCTIIVEKVSCEK